MTVLKASNMRQALHQHLAGTSARVINDLVISKQSDKADVAVIQHGRLHGFEMKTDTDCIEWHRKEIFHYSTIFDSCTLVTTPKHQASAASLVPSWWGIYVCDPDISVIRAAQSHSNVRAEALVQLLRKDEAVQWLKQLGIQRGIIGRIKEAAWERILETQTLEIIRSHVIRCLLSRSQRRTNRMLPGTRRLQS
ncbi:sce7726 family protein [Paenibacillus polymyxa]|uniref:sce7726 family protein n=1 Tax=Paenibacillus polymyxa TaxID=1406 RepID=UPI0025B6FF4F|nr:sce7726 family protein [Paenibacillus polymyxa]MDN4090887.1 sce7726 family protein [Paenibacillus polymyxa]